MSMSLPGPPVSLEKHFIPVTFLGGEREDIKFSGQGDDAGTSMPEPSPMVYDRTPSTPPCSLSFILYRIFALQIKIPISS
jgi:hypothetical protein